MNFLNNINNYYHLNKEIIMDENIKLFWNYLNQEDNNWFIFNNQFTTFSDYFLFIKLKFV